MPAYFTDKADSVPNICQSCYPKIVRWEGKPHCAPAAVSNSLVWLAENGFPDLQPFKDQDKPVAQAKLVDRLGEIMGTTKNGGTSPTKVLRGLKTFLELQGIKFKRMASVGWRSVPNFVAKDSRRVSLDWIKEGTLGKGAVWILIGWCKKDPEADDCKIFDGHWMTVVGYGKDRQGREDPNILIVHDPAERAERKSYYAKITELKKGLIDAERRTEGVLSLSGDVVLKPSADLGIIQGAYRLEF